MGEARPRLRVRWFQWVWLVREMKEGRNKKREEERKRFSQQGSFGTVEGRKPVCRLCQLPLNTRSIEEITQQAWRGLHGQIEELIDVVRAPPPTNNHSVHSRSGKLNLVLSDLFCWMSSAESLAMVINVASGRGLCKATIYLSVDSPHHRYRRSLQIPTTGNSFTLADPT